MLMSSNASIFFGMNESYTLTIDLSSSSVTSTAAGRGGTANPYRARLVAETIAGAYHGLESFSQLLAFDYETEAYVIGGAPLAIVDAPRFAWRELMVDCQAHYLPPRLLRQLVDSMTTAKLNVLQLHLAGFDSFPLALPSRPKLSKGAFSKYERYTLRDLAALRDYAAARGIRLIAELDTPGHAASWCVGMPELCPAPTGRCRQPLNPALNETFATIEAVLKDVVSVLHDEYIHLGEDEFAAPAAAAPHANDYSCWLSSPSIAAWLKKQGDWSGDDAAKYFLERTHAIARELGKQTLVWDEVWNILGESFDKQIPVNISVLQLLYFGV